MTDLTAIARKHRPVEFNDEPAPGPRDPRYSSDLTDSEIAELREIAPIRLAEPSDYLSDREAELQLDAYFDRMDADWTEREERYGF